MRPSNTVEAKRLAKTDTVIERAMGKSRSNRVELRFQLLDAAASRFGGFEIAMMAGAMAPDFEVTDREGKVIRMTDFKGMKALIVTWSSW